jgi:hypothetical protein
MLPCFHCFHTPNVRFLLNHSTRENAPTWNPNYKIFCDYEYFLRCLNVYRLDSIKLCSKVQVIYTQTNEGVIGKSNYKEWAEEIYRLCRSSISYNILNEEALNILKNHAIRWESKHNKDSIIEAFA